MVARGCGDGERLLMDRGFFLRDENVVKLVVVMVPQL